MRMVTRTVVLADDEPAQPRHRLVISG